MRKKKLAFAAVSAAIIVFCFCMNSVHVSATPALLKKGMSGSEVAALQKDLKTLGYFSLNPTGYYGGTTEKSVKNLQKKYGYPQDGIAGKSTLALIDRLLGRNAASSVSRGQTVRNNFLMSWFNGVENIFTIGETAAVLDIQTGLSFKVKRTYGYNHADCETLTANDTAVMKKIYGGAWSWSRRAIIVTVDGKRFAASMSGMPHAGNENYAANRHINSRSGGYGAGLNLDAVKGNKMSGHFCIHFYNSRTHGSNRVDKAHQRMAKLANEWAKENF